MDYSRLVRQGEQTPQMSCNQNGQRALTLERRDWPKSGHGNDIYMIANTMTQRNSGREWKRQGLIPFYPLTPETCNRTSHHTGSGAYTAGSGSGEVNQGPLEGPTHLAYRGIRGGTELATGGGRIEALTPYYGDEPSEWIGYLNMANDVWHSGIKNEVYDPRWGYESHWPRPKQWISRLITALPRMPRPTPRIRKTSNN